MTGRGSRAYEPRLNGDASPAVHDPEPEFFPEDRVRYNQCHQCYSRFAVGDDLLVAGFYCPPCREAGHGEPASNRDRRRRTPRR